jgi:DNA-binding transcriptional MerR regulator
VEAALDHKAPDAFRTISEVADELDLPQHVLRFWESRFSDIRPMKRGGGRRYYRPDDIDLLRGIRHLLYGEGYTIRGVQRILREQGVKFVQVVWREGAPQPPHGATEEEVYGDEDAPLPSVLDAEGRGLGGKLAALIGRDLGGRGDDDAPARREPPMQSAPVPHIDPDDLFDRASRESSPAFREELPDDLMPLPETTGRIAPLRREIREKLVAVVRELGECRKLIEAAARNL